jgi:hypothetical protein
MVQGAQWSAVRPSGIRRKKGRLEPIIQEQAKQGIATKMVTAKKEKEQQAAETKFQQDATTASLDLERKNLALAKKTAKQQKTQKWTEIGIAGLSTGLDLVSSFTSWLD